MNVHIIYAWAHRTDSDAVCMDIAAPLIQVGDDPERRYKDGDVVPAGKQTNFIVTATTFKLIFGREAPRKGQVLRFNLTGQEQETLFLQRRERV